MERHTNSAHKKFELKTRFSVIEFEKLNFWKSNSFFGKRFCDKKIFGNRFGKKIFWKSIWKKIFLEIDLEKTIFPQTFSRSDPLPKCEQ